VREAVDPWLSVTFKQHRSFADTVFDVLDWVSERCSVETLGVGQHVCHGAAEEFFCIERQHDGRQQRAMTLPFDHVSRGLGCARDTRSDRHGLLFDELVASRPNLPRTQEFRRISQTNYWG
jgi:hypothetical protein